MEVMPKGNAMSQEFYVREIFPKYIEEIRAFEKRYNRRIRLQEDGDPSHGNRFMNNLPARFKREVDLEIHIHPP